MYVAWSFRLFKYLFRTLTWHNVSDSSFCCDFVVQMSMAENEGGEGGSEEKMDVDDKEQDYSEVGHT